MESERKPRDFEQALKIFSLSYVLLTLIGLLYNFFYYQTFGISITQYIDLGEVLTLFTPLLTDFFSIMFLFWVPLAFIMRATYANYGEEKNKDLIRMCFIFFILFLLLSIVTYIVSNWHPVYLRTAVISLVVGVITFGPILLDVLFDFLEKTFYMQFPNFFREILLLLIILIGITCWTVFSQTERLKRKRIDKVYELVFKNNEPNLKTDSTIIFLGRTRSYIFIYDFKNNSSRVLNSEDIKELIISRKK
ncbi:MAG: hypothetical protein E6H09_20705 [Bacteroidetes bacterium]|nr:MAG: hypothetical protein E6H09_20705 [Bacteroidota bacterium]